MLAAKTSSIPRIVVAAVLIAQQICAQQPATGSGMKQIIVGLPQNAHVEVQLLNGTSKRGRIGSRGDNDFVLRSDRGGGTQTISYEQVRSVQRLNHSRAKWIAIGVLAGAAITVAIIVVYAVHHLP